MINLGLRCLKIVAVRSHPKSCRMENTLPNLRRALSNRKLSRAHPSSAPSRFTGTYSVSWYRAPVFILHYYYGALITIHVYTSTGRRAQTGDKGKNPAQVLALMQRPQCLHLFLPSLLQTSRVPAPAIICSHTHRCLFIVSLPHCLGARPKFHTRRCRIWKPIGKPSTVDM